MWEVPPAGREWSIPGQAAPPGLGQPSGPSHPPPGHPPEPTPKQLYARRLSGLAIAVSVGLVVAGLLAAFTAVEVAARADVLDGVTIDQLRGQTVTQQQRFLDDLQQADGDVGGAAGLYALGTLVTGILWIVWQRRFVRNAAPLGAIGRSLGWGTWGWLVPLANLYFPQAQLANAARLSDPARARAAGTGAASPLVYLWWGCYSLSTILSIGSSLAQPSITDFINGTVQLSDFQRADQIAAIAYWLAVVSAGLAVGAVLVSTQRQRRLFHHLGVQA